jgi:hypothetical protein
MWARTARTSLDMRMESFFAQMPDDLASAQWYRSSSGRQVHTMTWSDGSEVVTSWKDGPPGDGLRLDYVEKIGR